MKAPPAFTELPTEAQRLQGRNLANDRRLSRDRLSELKIRSWAPVVKWLINHPESTATDIFHATGRGVIGNPFIAMRRDGDRVLWSVNMLKYRRYLRTGKR